MSPKYVSSQDANPDSVTQIGAVEFVRPPLGVELCWLHYFDISTIQRNKGVCFCGHSRIDYLSLAIKTN